MTTTFTLTNSSVAVAPLDIIQAALLELNAIAAGEPVPSNDDTLWGLQKLQRLIDRWNAERDKIFTTAFNLFTMPANMQPISIGPGGQFQMNQRPVKLNSASLLLPNGGPTSTDLKLTVQDAQWWAAQTIKNLTSSISTDVYYDAANPLGNLFFWPISTVSLQVRIEAWVALTQAVDLTTRLLMPQAYWDAIVLSLAVQLAPSYEKVASEDLKAERLEAVRAIEGNNATAPKINLDGSGLPTSNGAGRTNDNFLTGQPW